MISCSRLGLVNQILMIRLTIRSLAQAFNFTKTKHLRRSLQVVARSFKLIKKTKTRQYQTIRAAASFWLSNKDKTTR